MMSLSVGRTKLSTTNVLNQPSNILKELLQTSTHIIVKSVKEITFLGHIIDAEGIRVDPEKTEAIRKMSPPTSVSELRRFMGMTNQLGKFTPTTWQTSYSHFMSL